MLLLSSLEFFRELLSAQVLHLSSNEHQIYLLIHASRDWFPESLCASPKIFFQFVINTHNGLHMASMFTSLCEFHGSCIVYQFNMSKTAASSSGKSAVLFFSPLLQLFLQVTHSNSKQPALPPTLNQHVSKGEVRECKSFFYIRWV